MINVPKLLSRLQGSKVYFDTNIFIYLLNGTPGLAAPCVQLLDACAQGLIEGVTGELTLAELLVQPLRRNDAATVALVRQLLIDDGAVSLLSHDRRAFERAAALRAEHGLKMPDALHIATAQLAGAGCLITNDRQFPSLVDLECINLHE